MKSHLKADSQMSRWSTMRVGLLAGVVMLFIPACAQKVQNSDEEGESQFSYEVDVSLEASSTQHPRPGGGAAPLAVIETRFGQAEFVANELTLWSDDASAVESARDELGAELLHESSSDTGPSMYVLRIDPTTVALEKFENDMRQVSPNADALGEIAFSSDEAARTLAAAASLHRRGLQADVTWVGRPSTIAERSSDESAAGWDVGRGNLGSDAYAWPHFSAESNQGTGVGEAWTLLERAGRLDNKVSIAVMDAGFCPTRDFHATRGFNMILGGQELVDAFVDVSDLIGETPGSSPICDWVDFSAATTSGWHGTHVYNALMGRHDNGFGTTGPASPVVADPTLFVNMMYDTVSTIVAMNQLRHEGADIVNMSFHIPVPAGLQWTHLGYEMKMLSYFEDDGILMFAAAGNEGENIDERWSLLGADMGEVWQNLPCESDGVICVGGVEHNGTDLSEDSNFGSSSVDITGPFVVPGGPDRDAPADNLELMAGTSFAAPHVAGVAALVWAADPSMNAAEVRDHLYETSLSGSYGDRARNGYACALCAVREIVPNTAPAMRLISPRSGSTQVESDKIVYEVAVDDIEDELEGHDTQIVWYEGGRQFFTGASYAIRRCPGIYDYRVEATDSDGATTSMEFQIEVKPADVTLAIAGYRQRSYRVEEHPDGTQYTRTPVVGAAVLHPTCSDPDSANVPEHRIEWRDSSGNLLGTGPEYRVKVGDLKDAHGAFAAVELEARLNYLGHLYTDDVILTPCSSDAAGGTYIDDYAKCSRGALIGDMLASLSEVLGDEAWEDAEERANVIAGELYREPLGQLGLCETETCDPEFPRPLDAVSSDLYDSYHELVVSNLRNVVIAASDAQLDELDAATKLGYEVVGMLDAAAETQRAMLERGLVVAGALTDFYMPTADGGRNGWAEMAFVTNPETMSTAQAMRPVEAGVRAFLDAATITGDPNSPLNVEAAEYASIREAIRVADDAPVE